MFTKINSQMAAPRVSRCFRDFWLKPASPKPLAAFRIGVAAVLLFQAMSLMGSVSELYGENALISWSALRISGAFPMAVQGPFHLESLSSLLAPLGIDTFSCVHAVFFVYVAALVGLLLGFRTRLVAIIAFATHLLLTNSSQATIYGVDQFARIALFYCLWMPIGAAISWDSWMKAAKSKDSVSARVGVRVIQLHLAIMYLATGLHKASGHQWWDGEAIWRAVTLPELAQFDMTWLAGIPWLPLLVGWGTLALECGYCLLVWHRQTRFVAVASIISMHVGIATMMGLTSFAFLMIALNVAAFMVSPELQLERSPPRRLVFSRILQPAA